MIWGWGAAVLALCSRAPCHAAFSEDVAQARCCLGPKIAFSDIWEDCAIVARN